MSDQMTTTTRTPVETTTRLTIAPSRRLDTDTAFAAAQDAEGYLVTTTRLPSGHIEVEMVCAGDDDAPVERLIEALETLDARVVDRCSWQNAA